MGPGLLLGLTAVDAALGLGDPSILIAQAEAPDPAMPSPNPVPNPVLLGPGANPQEVKILQQQLTQLGFYSGSLDGDYNAATQEAVKAFQASAGLTVTGLLDNQTWERMSTPQLLSGADPAAAEPEVPSLLTPSSTAEPSTAEPSTDSPSANDPSADSPSPETASADPATADAPSADASPPQTPTADANVATDTEVSPGRRRTRWLLALPLAGAALLGLGWGWQRRSASARRNPPEADDPNPGTDTVSDAVPDEQGAKPDPSHADPSHADPSYAAPLLELAAASVQEGNGGHAVSPNRSSTLPAVPKRAAGSLPVSQPEVARLPTVNIVGTLVGELGSADATVRRRAIWELGQRGNSTAIEPLVNGLMEADSQEKSLIFAALAEIGSRSLQPMQRALALGLQDSSPEVRKNAIRDLSRLYDSLGQIRPLLIHATQDPDPEVQATAQWALGQLSRIPPAPAIESSIAQLTYPGDRLPPSDSSVQ